MATSTIKQQSVGSIEIDLSGTEVTRSDSGWYFAQIDISSYIPSGTRLIGVAMSDTWDGNVFYEPHGQHTIIIKSSTSKTLGNNHKAFLYYV